jgi:hypothetical protein
LFSRSYPSLYQIHTCVWLTELFRKFRRAATLDDVPDAGLETSGAGQMIQEGKEGSRVFLIGGEAQKKKLTSFSLDAESMRGPLGPELPSCSEISVTPGILLGESRSSP